MEDNVKECAIRLSEGFHQVVEKEFNTVHLNHDQIEALYLCATSFLGSICMSVFGRESAQDLMAVIQDFMTNQKIQEQDEQPTDN